VHAGIAAPRTFPAGRCGVQNEDVVDARTQQPESRRKTRLAGADHDDVERRKAVGARHRLEPRRARMGNAREIARDAAFED